MLSHLVNILPHAYIGISYPYPLHTNRKYVIRYKYYPGSVTIFEYFIILGDIPRARSVLMQCLDNLPEDILVVNASDKVLLDIMMEIPYTAKQASNIINSHNNCMLINPIFDPLAIKLSQASGIKEIWGHCKILGGRPDITRDENCFHLRSLVNNPEEVKYLLSLMTPDERILHCNNVVNVAFCLPDTHKDAIREILPYVENINTLTYCLYYAMVHDVILYTAASTSVVSYFLHALYNDIHDYLGNYIELDNINYLEPMLTTPKRISVLSEIVLYAITSGVKLPDHLHPRIHEIAIKLYIRLCGNCTNIRVDNCELCQSLHNVQ